MIVYGDLFEHAVTWKDDHGVMKVVGIFPTFKAAKVFHLAALRDAPLAHFEVTTLNEFEKNHCEPIVGHLYKQAG